RCWRQIADAVPGFAPIADDRVVFVGGRDASDAERARLASIAWIRENALDDVTALDMVATRVRRVHLHVDLDIHGAESLKANGYASKGGPNPERVLDFVRAVAARFAIAGAAVASFDPAADDDGSAL